MRRVVFDAYAVVAWLEGEPGEPYVSSLMREVEEGRLWAGVCAVNVGEVYHRTRRLRGGERAEECLSLLCGLKWEIVSASNELVWEAARLKAQFPISYADAFAVACAQRHDADLITNDPELRDAAHGVAIRWEAT